MDQLSFCLPLKPGVPAVLGVRSVNLSSCVSSLQDSQSKGFQNFMPGRNRTRKFPPYSASLRKKPKPKPKILQGEQGVSLCFCDRQLCLFWLNRFSELSSRNCLWYHKLNQAGWIIFGFTSSSVPFHFALGA